jgi:hypothetical protein
MGYRMQGLERWKNSWGFRAYLQLSPRGQSTAGTADFDQGRVHSARGGKSMGVCEAARVEYGTRAGRHLDAHHRRRELGVRPGVATSSSTSSKVRSAVSLETIVHVST